VLKSKNATKQTDLMDLNKDLIKSKKAYNLSVMALFTVLKCDQLE
jgi:hypothetical protein